MGEFDRVVAKGLRAVRRIVVVTIGFTILLIGIVLLVLPGPAVVVIPVGLGILAIEFEWARRWLRKARGVLESAAGSSGISAKQQGVQQARSFESQHEGRPNRDEAGKSDID